MSNTREYSDDLFVETLKLGMEGIIPRVLENCDPDKSILSHSILFEKAQNVQIFSRGFKENIFNDDRVIKNIKTAISYLLSNVSINEPLINITIKEDRDVYLNYIKNSKFIEEITKFMADKNKTIQDILHVNFIDKSKVLKMRYEIDVFQKDGLYDFEILDNQKEDVKKVVSDIPSFALFTDRDKKKHLRVRKNTDTTHNSEAIIKCCIKDNMDKRINAILTQIKNNIVT